MQIGQFMTFHDWWGYIEGITYAGYDEVLQKKKREILAWGFIIPLKILQHISEVQYKLDLPLGLLRVPSFLFL